MRQQVFPFAVKTVGQARRGWSNREWGEWLGCAPADVSKLRKLIRGTFFVQILRRREDLVPLIVYSLEDPEIGNEEGVDFVYKYSIAITQRHDTPSGCYREIPACSFDREYDSPGEAAEMANSYVIPQLTLSPKTAELSELPERSLQLLRVDLMRQRTEATK